MSKVEQVKALKKQCLVCQRCSIGCFLVKDQYDPHVFGWGNINSEILLCGMNPAFKELVVKEPFVGRAGNLYTTSLDYIGLEKRFVYTTNLLKCATIENGKVRTPEQDEIDKCEYIITQEIKIIDPKLIVVFGNQPMAAFTGIQFGVTDLTGDIIHNDHLDKDIFIMMHPAAVVRSKKKNYPVYKSGIRKLKEYIYDNQLNAKFLMN